MKDDQAEICDDTARPLKKRYQRQQVVAFVQYQVESNSHGDHYQAISVRLQIGKGTAQLGQFPPPFLLLRPPFATYDNHCHNLHLKLYGLLMVLDEVIHVPI